jgi:hypothetical protein
MLKIEMGTFLNHLCRNWVVVEGKGRSVNGILGLLCREHYPGLVQLAGEREPAYTFDHYAAAPDVVYGNKAERVRRELWVSLSRTTSHSLYFTSNN